ncbi:hypothetical protein Cgig2_022124 [Carnegiea gigantea]|uniref:At4g14310 8-bladed propeller domain-containing protein n=1 Tax=Carnegiea gigantea TaxID=171969 RepID=A0A9Q1K1Q9_9CARY|nr:hypothetical protein Cgig2_022124 [Carnegiea gigantea]
MSTASARRLKERGGNGGKIASSMPTKALTPVSEKPSSGSARKSAGDRENNPPITRSNSRVSGSAQKPAMRPMPRMSSAASGGGESRPRSRPRGRSPSPSDLNRVLSDLRKSRVSSSDTFDRNERSVGSSGKGLDGFRVLDKKGCRELSQKVSEKGVNGFRVSADGKEDAIAGEKSVGESKAGNKRLNLQSKKEDNLSKNSVRPDVDDVGSGVSSCSHHYNKDGNISSVDKIISHQEQSMHQNVVLRPHIDPIPERSVSEKSLKRLGAKSMGNLKDSDVDIEKGLKVEGTCGHSGKKHASKLHEKLAYLEGKVKRIASDIKRTKEILDKNNDDASKVILSDIQERISGIEKAMGNVITDSDMQVMGDSESGEVDSVQRPACQAEENDKVDSAKVSAKGLSCEELEARLFPHHRLLRNRTSVKVSAPSSFTDAAHMSEFNSVSNSENSLHPIDMDQSAVGFPLSFNKLSDAGFAVKGDEIQETEDTETSVMRQSSGIFAGKNNTELDLQADERLDEFDEQENKPPMVVEENMEDNSISQLMEIGQKICTGGWFVSDGESVLLAHNDGSCSFYDIANREEKAEYRPPAGIPEDLWRDCWIVRAPSADGCSGKYVVAASAGNSIDSGFCSWDFYSKEVQAFHIEDNTTSKSNTRIALGPLSDNLLHRRNALSSMMSSENQQWWYRPCGPLIISTASCQKAVKVFDIRDGEQVLKWDVQKPILAMDYSSPLQWRNRGKAVVAETEAISLWDVSSLNARALLSVSTSGHRISALHVNNTDAELGAGVRQRVSTSEAEGNDGVFCTADSINILDFRKPSGIGLKIPRIGLNAQCVSSRGDSIFLGCSTVSSSAKKQANSQVLQFSLRAQRIVNTYLLPESSAHTHHKALTEVWGNSNLVMAVCGLGLFVFDALRDEGVPSLAVDYSSPQTFKEVIGPDDLYSPSFDYASSQILLISRDRPAMWRHLTYA